MGYGFSLSVPRVARKTDKGLPRYDDADPDTFILSDTEDLVPALREDSSAEAFDVPNLHGKRYFVRRYRPRVEGAFARIEWWREPATGETHWRTVTRDNITHIYGESPDARIQSPDKKPRVFAWLLERTYDDKGNAVAYEYKRENTDNVPDVCHEKNRAVGANRYLKRISYAYQTTYWPDVDPAVPNDWHFQVVFDYGEHDLNSAKPGDEKNKWPCRPDAFSQYRAAFEVRTLRRLRRIFVLHRFAELGVDPYLVSSTDFTYAEDGAPPKKSLVASFVTAITQCGYIRDVAGWRKETLPPLELKYSEVEIDPTLHRLDPVAQENLPEGIDNRRYHWVDLDSEGLPGVLAEQVNGAWYYKHSDPVFDDTKPSPRARFLPIDEVNPRPSSAALASGRQQIFDIGGEGTQCLVDFARPLAGYYERDGDGFKPFRSFREMANVDLSDPSVRTIDLTGDGHADILILGDVVFTWFPSKGKDGFGAPSIVRAPGNDERGARVVFARGGEAIILCDMSGDGMNDLVRVRAGSVEYWPSLGYGKFGPKVTMSNPPKFEAANEFDPKRVRAIDVDASGSTDFLYLHREGAKIFYNRSANSFSDAVEIAHRATDNFSSVAALDLLGNGTACLVWSSPLGKDASQPMLYMDLMGGKKPHLLVEMRNNLGAETRVRYAPSTKFYLEDRRTGKPWITKLPFPVHVVEQVEVFERISETKLVTRYKYHHGYFDSREKEFRGFSRVDQYDGEIFSRYSGKGLFTEVPKTAGDKFHLPPIRTVTWFHTGAFVARDRISTHLRGEYYAGDPQAKLLDDTTLPAGLSTREMREACRALKGRMLRQEVYADDETALAGEPYVVTEYAYGLRRLQRKADNQHAVFHSYQSEAITYHYERKSGDPRIGHEMALEVDKLGNITQSVGIAYRRRPGPDVEPEQSRTLITYTSNRVFNKTDAREWYRIGVPIETRTFELTGFTPLTGDYFTLADFIVAGSDPVALRYDRELDYEKSPTSGRERRLIEHVRTIHRNDDLSGPLALGTVHSRAIIHENYKLALTPGLITKAFGSRVTESMLRDEGRYVHSEGDANWWIPSGRIFFSPLEADTAAQEFAFAKTFFFLPRRFLDPSGGTSFAVHDSHHLLIAQTKDAIGNTVSAKNHYRTLYPQILTDANGNRTAVRFDARRMVVASFVMGKAGTSEGDRFDDTVDEASPQDDPTIRLTYGLLAHMNDPARRTPTRTHTESRETHRSPASKWQHSYSYIDGLGRVVEKKVQAELGLAPVRNAAGDLVRDGAGQMVPWEATATRWVGSGFTISDNKANPIKIYESFFDSSPAFNREKDLVEFGVTPIFRYDALGRLIRTDLPNGAISKTEFDAWDETSWDENDTVLESQWYALRNQPDPAGPEPIDEDERAAWRAAYHAGTPSVIHLDALGRHIVTVADNTLGPRGVARQYRTRSEMDIEGNRRSVTDALDRRVVLCDYDMVGAMLREASMDSGERWSLSGVAGNVVREWDSRDHMIRTSYDELQRPTHVFLQRGSSSELLVERIVYGEWHSDASRNLRGQVHRRYDGAGVVTHERYDFKGNLIESNRRLARQYRQLVDWSALATASSLSELDVASDPSLESEIFAGSTHYDALNRPTMIVTPHAGSVRANVIQPAFNEANLLDKVDVWLRVALVPSAALEPSTADLHAVTNIDYNAKGQRVLIRYGSGVETQYRYDPETFRLVHLYTRRGGAFSNDCGGYPPAPRSASPQEPPTGKPCGLQNLRYTYDAVGNIVNIRDSAQQTIFFRNFRVEPTSEFRYDAIYRLVEATGREHLGVIGGVLNAPELVTYDETFRTALAHPHDGEAMGAYLESYEYDAVGNILRMEHQAVSGTWTRRYAYNEPSLLEAGRTNNRLSRTSVPGDDPLGPYSIAYGYDEDGGYGRHGNVTRMSQLPLMRWDYRDRLQATSKQVVNEGVPETTYYVYNANGERTRRVTERATGDPNAGVKLSERIYLGGFEIYREFSGNGTRTALERETLHVMDDTRRIALVETKTYEASLLGDLFGLSSAEEPLVRYQLCNHLGTAMLELDRDAEIVSYEEHFPFGESSLHTTQAGVNAIAKRFRYSAKERDEQSDLYYYGARYYAAWLGRWISCDPLGIADGVNRLAFVQNNPIGRLDRHGLQGDNSTDDMFLFIRNQAGFQAGQQRPPTFQSSSGSPMGTYSHAEATNVVQSMKQIGVKGADQIYSEVAVNRQTGVVTQIGGRPIPGHHNIDLVRMPSGTAPLRANQSTLAPGQAAVVGDLKYGKGEITQAHSAFGQRAVTVNGRTGNTPTATAPQATASAPKPTAVRAPVPTGNAPAAAAPAAAAPAPKNTSTGPASAPVPSPASTRPSGAGVTTPRANFGAAAMNVAGGTALAATRTLVPGVVEAEIGLGAAGMYASAAGYTTVGAGLTTAATAVPVVGGGLVTGAIVGNIAEAEVRAHGGSETVAQGAGALSSAGSGAAVGALIVSVIPGVGTAAGAVIGGVAGLGGYYLSKIL